MFLRRQRLWVDHAPPSVVKATAAVPALLEHAELDGNEGREIVERHFAFS